MTNARNAREKTALEPAALDLGRQLKAMFDSIADDPMPEHLIALVEALERQAQRASDARH